MSLTQSSLALRKTSIRATTKTNIIILDSIHFVAPCSLGAGCLLHLPSMLRHNHTDLLVAHFLGVDHVGHTYGPNGVEMVEKLKQMDDVLVDILDVVEQNEHGCSVAFVFGGERANDRK